MTILCATADHLVEFEDGFLSIARYADGHALALSGNALAGQFRACLKTHSPERTVECFIRMGEASYRRMVAKPGYRSPFGCLDHRDAKGWEPLYKPHRMPGRNMACDICEGRGLVDEEDCLDVVCPRCRGMTPSLPAEASVGIAAARPLGIGQREEGGCRDA